MGVYRTCIEPDEIKGNAHLKDIITGPFFPRIFLITYAVGSGNSLGGKSLQVVPARESSGNVFRVGIFLDFVRLTARTPRGGCIVRVVSQTELN